MIGVSLFSSAGIGELLLKDIGINIVLSSELIKKRSDLYEKLHLGSKSINGDIEDPSVFEEIINKSPDNIDFLLASPPCQGLSIAGKNRSQNSMSVDTRNYLINKVIDFIKIKKPTYIVIENVPSLLKLLLFHNGELKTVPEILKYEFGGIYNVEYEIIDSADLGIPQYRKRAIIKLYKKGKPIKWPEIESRKITVKEAIGHLPSLEAGESSEIKWHFARNHDKRHVEWMKNTPTGKSAFDNEVFFPQKENGDRIKGYNTTYRRILWDEPVPTVTMRNDAISSQKNVHPGRLKNDGTYSDARVLTPLELMILSSIPEDWALPSDTPEILIRQCIGECIPPLMLKKIIGEI